MRDETKKDTLLGPHVLAVTFLTPWWRRFKVRRGATYEVKQTNSRWWLITVHPDDQELAWEQGTVKAISLKAAALIINRMEEDRSKL